MSRNITTANKTAAEAAVITPIFFIKLEYDSGTSRMHTSVGTLTFGGESYLGVGGLLSIDRISEDSELGANGIRGTLSGVDSGLVATALGEDYQGRPAYIYFGLLDENEQLVDDPMLVFSGRMDTQPIVLGKNASITLTAESRLIDWDRVRTYRLNNETQQSLFPGDKGLEFVEQAAEKPIFFGVASPQ